MKENSSTGEDGVLCTTTVILALVLLIIAGALVIGYVGGEDDGPSVQTVTATVPPFANLWNGTVAIVDVQNSSAELIDFWIRMDFNRTPTFAWLNFIGRDSNGTSRSYDVQWYPPDRLVIIVSSKPVETLFSGKGCHPMYVLEQIDQVDLAKVLPGDGRMEVSVMNSWGSFHYDNRSIDLYLLENGSFTPLKHVAYSTDEPVYTVAINRIESSDSESSGSVVYPRPKEERSQLIALLPPDLAKADEIIPVMMASTDLPNFDYAEVPVISPGETDWMTTNASYIARIALRDKAARVMYLEGGTVEGVLLSCHPTPFPSSGDGCAPALRIANETATVDFLVNETEGRVISTVTEK